MTDNEKIEKIGEILDKYCQWVNKSIKNGFIYDLAGLHHTQTYPSLMLWLDYNYKAEADKTDSETFLRLYAETAETFGELIGNIERFIGYSKFAFIDGNGNVVRFGPFIVDRGVQYSNQSFRAGNMRTCADPRLWRTAI